MEDTIIDGLSSGVATVILCTSGIAQPLRELPWLKRIGVLKCCFCTSFWISLLHDPSTTVLATMAIANITIMLTHWSMTTYSNEEETDAETS